MAWFKRNAPREDVSAFAVFTPGVPATLNFVPREAQIALLDAALSTPGKQLVVFGESGSGKSTLLNRELKSRYPDPITTRCTESTTFQSMLMQAFDELGKWVDTERTAGNSIVQNHELSAGIAGVKAGLGSSQVSSSASKEQRLVPVQLTPQKLGELLGAAGQCWLVEDFHKVPDAEKRAFSQTLKVFSDLGGSYELLRVVVVGATDAARDIVEYDREMVHRVAEIYVPPMSELELARLVAHGGELMNVDFRAVSDGIVRNSIGSGSVAHQLALNCLLARKIKRRPHDTVRLEQSDLRAAANMYVDASSATLRARFGKALFRTQATGYDNCRIILESLAAAPVKGVLHGELLAMIKLKFSEYPSGNLTTYLRQLSAEERGTVVRKHLDGRFSFSEPLLHTYARLHLLDGAQPEEDDIYGVDMHRIAVRIDGVSYDF